jgi:glyoxylase-like metal-dependent hydrolase (beta-lactamase superfamily II)
MKPGEIIPVAGPVSLVAGLNGGNFPRCHGVLIQDRETALIDPGCGREVLEPLVDRVDLVINTHSHPDHTSGNYLFTRSDIWLPVQAKDSAGDMVNMSRRFTQPGPLAEYWLSFAKGQLGFQEYQPTGFFEPGQEIKIGRTRLRVVHVPGHTVDHCCFHLPDHNMLLSADVDFTVFGPWYGHIESDLTLFRDSLKKLYQLKPKVTVSAHSEPLREGFEQALDAFIGIMDKRSASILRLIGQEQSLDQLVDQAPIYRRFPFAEPLLRFWEERMIQEHLKELITQGKARNTGHGFAAL